MFSDVFLIELAFKISLIYENNKSYLYISAIEYLFYFLFVIGSSSDKNSVSIQLQYTTSINLVIFYCTMILTITNSS